MSLSFGNVPTKATLECVKFTAAALDSELEDFYSLLKLSKVGPVTYEGSQSDLRYGITHEWLQNTKEYWLSKFDWRASEKKINSFPNFKTSIVDNDGLQYLVHFTALFSNRADAIPLVLLHGWPGSFLEFLPILSMFSEEYSLSDLPFHIVVPSLPGYGYSSGPPIEKDFTVHDIPRIIDLLMKGLGFGSGYIAQGGDVGSGVARSLSKDYESCKAIHLNLWTTGQPIGSNLDSITNPVEREGLVRAQKFRDSGLAYAITHDTRPSTISLALSASPLSLLAWIGEKFLTWSDEDLPIDIILESVTLYWLTDSFPRSLYPYRQLVNTISDPDETTPYLSKPLGFSWFPKEVVPVPKSWIESGANLVFYRLHSKGGHFAALENPKAIKEDLVKFCAQVWTVNR